ncbi:MAG TPA: 4-hydroxy-tetrahydrodipicolinate reductase [Drouetiella sp.]
MAESGASTRTVKVVIAGVNGRMGRASVQAIRSNAEFELVGAFGSDKASYVGSDVYKLAGVADSGSAGILVSNDFSDSVSARKPDALLDFTNKAEIALANAKRAIELGIRPVIGTSGISKESLEELSQLSSSSKIGAMVIPNFSVGAVLMMEFARQAACIFQNVEVVELHHTKKLDAPSGTAMHTLNKMAETGNKFNPQMVQEKELMPGARGAKNDANIRVHSLRLPGLISHQEVLFGSDGELLTIKHDSFNTSCFSKGILLALKSVCELDRLVVGLDSVLMQNVH